MTVLFALGLLAVDPMVSTSAGTPAPVATLRPALLGTDREAATSAVEAVSLLGGAEAFRAVADFQAHWGGDKEMAEHGLSALRRLQIATGELSRIIRADADAGHRAWAAWTAGMQEIDGCQEALIGALKDPDAAVRARAIGALAALGGFGASDALLHAAVHDSDPENRDRASVAVGTLGASRPPKPPLEEAVAELSSADPFERLAAAKTLRTVRDRRSVFPLLSALTRESDVGVKKEIISALADTRDEIAVPRLIEVSRHDVPEVRVYAIAALATLDDSRAVAPLSAFLHDSDPEVRRYSVRALTMLGRPGAATSLLGALPDPVMEVRLEAAKDLSQLADRGTAGALAARLLQEPDPAVREVLTRTLGELGTAGDAGEERALLKGLDDEDPGVRSASAGALGRIGSKARSERPLRLLIEKESKKKKGEKDDVLIEVATDALKAVEAR